MGARIDDLSIVMYRVAKYCGKHVRGRINPPIEACPIGCTEKAENDGACTIDRVGGRGSGD